MISRRWTLQLHRWVGILSCLFLLLVASTSLALSHSDLWRPLLLRSAAPAGFSLAQARVVAADPHRPARLLAASDKTLFESTDGGQHWQELKLFVPAEKVSGLAFAPQHPGWIWVALSESGIYFSEDDGAIWEEISDLPFNPVAGEPIRTLWVGAGPTLFVQTDLAVYQRRAGGSWQKQILSRRGRQVLDFQDLIWRLHTGRFAGSVGILLYDAVALSLIFLSLSGLWLFRRPRRKRLNSYSAPPAATETLAQEPQLLNHES